LDKFLSNTTSEDNQSFNEIIKEAEIQFQKKVVNYKIFPIKISNKIKHFISRMPGYLMVKKKL